MSLYCQSTGFAKWKECTQHEILLDQVGFGEGVHDKINFRFSAIWQKTATADCFSVVENIRNNIMFIYVASLCIN